MERQTMSTYRQSRSSDYRRSNAANRYRKNDAAEATTSIIEIIIRQALVAGIIMAFIFALRTIPDKNAKAVFSSIKTGVKYNMNISKQTKTFDKYLDKFFKNTKRSGKATSK